MSKSTRRLFLGFIALAIAVAYVVFLLVPDFSPETATSKTNRIFDNLRHIDAAKFEWALEHHQTNDVVVTKEEIAPYFDRSPTPKWVESKDGERYFIGTLWESPKAELTRKVEGYPKGTVLILGTNGAEFILPNKIGAANAGGRFPFRLASQARHQRGAPNGLLAARIVVAGHAIGPVWLASFVKPLEEF